MSVVFDYTKLYSLLVTDYEITPTDAVFWRDIYNPGHAGTNIYLELSLDGSMFTIKGGSTWSWKIQYALLATPTTWVDLVTRSGITAAALLTVGLDATETGNMVVDDYSVFTEKTAPTYGKIYIGTEVIEYSGGETSGSISIHARGINGSVAATHSIGDIATLLSIAIISIPAEASAIYIETPIINPILLRLIGTAAKDMAAKAVTDLISFRMVGTV